MGLFRKKEPPKACPKCGRADGWRLVVNELPPNNVTSSEAVNPFSSAPIRNSFGQNATASVGRRIARPRYRCEFCGCEKRY